MEKQTFCLYYIDIVGTCNLSCPSCPVGNYQVNDFISNQRPKGFMAFSLFEKILDKIELENSHNCEDIVIALYNWGEPLLHPEFPKFIEAIRTKGFYSDVSSNLNVKDVKNVVVASPNKLIISLSGYDNEIYSQTHKAGNSHLVLSNLFKLRYYMDKLKKNFSVEVSYHIYEHNVGKDMERIKMITEDLGFRFCSDLTLFMPLENNFKYLNGEKLSQQDQNLISLMLVKPEELINLAQPYKQVDCPMRNWTVINFDGTTALCCGVYDYQYNIADNFLNVSQLELDERKQTHQLCVKCMDKGLHVMASYTARKESDEIIETRLKMLKSQLLRDSTHLRSFNYLNE
jgi:hypothetical protein